MKIVMLCEYYYPFDRGGSEWSTHILSKSLIRHGHLVEIFTPRYGSKENEVFDDVHIYRFPYIKINHLKVISPLYFVNPLWHISVFISLLKYTRKKSPHIIHIQGKYFLPAAILVSKLTRIPTVTTLRDYTILCPYAFCISGANHYNACSFKRILFRDRVYFLNNYTRSNSLGVNIRSYVSAVGGWVSSRILRYFVSRSDKVIAISESVKKIYIHNGIRVDKVIYNSSEFPNKRPSLIKNTILYVGRLTPGKGISILIEAYKKLSLKNVPRLIILGEPVFPLNISDDFKDKVIILGKKTREKMLKIIRTSRFIVVPSVWEEPFGRVALEALANGTPALVSNKGGLPEIIENKKTGCVVDPTAEEIEKGLRYMLKNDEKLRKKIYKVHESLKEKFNNRPVNEYVRTYSSMIAV